MFGCRGDASNSECFLPDDIEESDALNEETFGIDPIPEEEWEIEDISEQTEVVDQSSLYDSGSSDDLRKSPDKKEKVGDSPKEWYKNYDKSFQEILEKDLCNLLTDDDYPSNYASPVTNITSDLSSYLTNSCSISSFFDVDPYHVDSINSIWNSVLTSSSNGAQKPPARSTPPISENEVEKMARTQNLSTNDSSIDKSTTDQSITDEKSIDSLSLDSNSLRALLSQLKSSAVLSENMASDLERRTASAENDGSAAFLPPKNVKTLAELESELLAKHREKTAGPDVKKSGAHADVHAVAGQNHVSPLDILTGSAPRATVHMPPPGTATFPSNTANFPPMTNQQQAALLAAAFLGPRQQQHPQHRPLQYPAPPWMLDPQIRAAVLTCLAAGKPIPPGILRPPFPVPHQIAQRFGIPMPPGLSHGNLMDPRLIFSARANLAKSNDPVQSFVKIRPIVPVQSVAAQRFFDSHRRGDAAPSAVRTLTSQQYQRRAAVDDDAATSDEYGGLMSKGERNWLVKVQSVQLYTENPYRDDYYWLMYKRKKILALRKNAENDSPDTSSDYLDSTADAREMIEHRSYVPPSFEGSLGKLHVSSSAGPRQIIDLGGDSALKNNSCDATRRDSVGSSRSTPSLSVETGWTTPAPFLGLPPVSRSKLNTGLLLDIENGYILALECDEWLVELKTFNMHYMSDKIRENLDKILSNTSKVMTLIANDAKKFQSVLCSRKGRRLVTKILPFLQDAERTTVINLFADLLLKKSFVNQDEVCSFFLNALHETLQNSGSSNWSSIFAEILTVSRLRKPQYTGSERFFNVVVVLLLHCAKQNGPLNDSVAENVIKYLHMATNELRKPNSKFIVCSTAIGFCLEDANILCAYLIEKLQFPKESVEQLKKAFKLED